ncbi:MAG: hemerythrin family protein [Treponema sp.]|nr:hemerythrin family protein [Treponema sp.]
MHEMYEWDSALETGNEKIDSQHKQLIAALNDLIEAFAQGKGKDEITKTMEFISTYAIMHFSMEEELMVESEYSEYKNHKRYHDEFKVVLGSLIERLVDEGPTEGLIDIVISTIRDWLINHIKGDDFRMATYVKTRS